MTGRGRGLDNVRKRDGRVVRAERTGGKGSYLVAVWQAAPGWHGHRRHLWRFPPIVVVIIFFEVCVVILSEQRV